MADAWPPGVERIVLDEVTSTNDVAMSFAKSGTSRAWILAHTQTGSKGRRGRPWVFQKGNFAGSYVTWPKAPRAEIAQMSFVAAVALSEAFFSFRKDAPVQLKWPNDVLLDGQKVSGILLESFDAKGRTGLIIGVGVNLLHAPSVDEIEQRALPPISLAEAGFCVIRPETFLDEIAWHMAKWETIWSEQGFGPIRDAWRNSAIGLGQPIVARLPGRTLTGHFEDIDEMGCLVLKTETGREVLPAGDVYFPQIDN